MKPNKKVDVFKSIKIIHKDDGEPDNEACWEYDGFLRKGNRDELRGMFSYKGKKEYAHRVVWELFNGRELNANEVVRHTCDNTKCCNPHHLESGVQRDNVLDMYKRERVGYKHWQIQKVFALFETHASAQFIKEYMKEKHDVDFDRSMLNKIRKRTVYAHMAWPWGDEWAKANANRKRPDNAERVKKEKKE